MKSLARAIGRILSLVALVVVAWAGWRWGDHVFPDLERRVGLRSDARIEVVAEEPSEALAQAATERIEGLASGRREEVELTGVELTSLIRYGAAEAAPSGLRDPAVRLEGGRAHLTAQVAPAEFPGLPDLGPAAGMLPDLVPVELQGAVMGFGSGEAAVVVLSAEVAGVPLPRRLVPEILAALGRTDRPGLPAEAIAVALPAGAESAHISGDRLVLVPAP